MNIVNNESQEIVVEINSSVLSKLIEISEKLGVDYDCFEGVLQDNYVFYNAEIINIDKKSSHYIIVKETYINEWSSGLVAIMTNSYDEVEKYKANMIQ